MLKKLPLHLANELGKLTLKYRLAGFLYLLLTFFFIPFTLIYSNQDSAKRVELVYEKITPTDTLYFRISTNVNIDTHRGEWIYYTGQERTVGEEPLLIYPVIAHERNLVVGKDQFFFEEKGFCWDGENEAGTYKACVDQILPAFKVIGVTNFDSVYVFKFRYNNADSAIDTYVLDDQQKILLQHVSSKPNYIERLIGIKTLE